MASVSISGKSQKSIGRGGKGVKVSSKGSISASGKGLRVGSSASASVDTGMTRSSVDVKLGVATGKESFSGYGARAGIGGKINLKGKSSLRLGGRVWLGGRGKSVGGSIDLKIDFGQDLPEPTPTPTPTPSPDPDPIAYPIPMGKYAVIRLNDPVNEPWDEEDLAWDTEQKMNPIYNPANPRPEAVFHSVQEMFESYILGGISLTVNDIGILKKTGWGYVQNQGRGEIIGHFYIYRSDANVHIQNGTEWGLWFTDNQGNEIYAQNRFRDSISYPRVFGYHWYSYLGAGIELIPLDIPVVIPEFKNKERSIPKMTDCDCCKMIEEIYDVIRPDKFVFKLPESFRTIDGNEPKNKDIDDYPEAFGYLLDRIDELIGQFNIDIEIEDTDPVTQGNQTAKISIGNISEGIAEIIGLIYGLGMSQKIGTEASVKSLITLGMVQRTITEIDAVTEEIFDHLEIPMKEVEREIDLEFTPGVKNFDAFFKPSKERVKVPERLEGKNTPTLQDQMEVLLQAATIIKSRGFKKIDPYKDIGAQVMGNLASGLIDRYVLKNSPDNPDAPPDSTKKSDFDDFIKDVEENFKDYEKPGEIDLEKSDNPKIVKLNKPVPTPAPKPNPPTGN
jgi:hypothetical protein